MYCKNCGENLNENQDFCPICGVYKGNGNHYCDDCGGEISENAAFCANCGKNLKQPQTDGERVAEAGIPENVLSSVQPRNIVTAIILSIVTCGIYGIYWFIVLTDEINRLTGKEKDISGVLAFVLTLVTCGIYGYVWAYQMGQKVDRLTNSKDGNNPIIYLIVMLVGLGIVDYVLIQDAINKTVENR